MMSSGLCSSKNYTNLGYYYNVFIYYIIMIYTLKRLHSEYLLRCISMFFVDTVFIKMQQLLCNSNLSDMYEI